jgi:hypothetical protein
VIENLAVEDDAQLARLVEHRLLPGRDVDDAQPSMAKCCIGIAVKAFSVRTSVANNVSHLAQHAFRDDGRCSRDESGDAAHIRRGREVSATAP